MWPKMIIGLPVMLHIPGNKIMNTLLTRNTVTVYDTQYIQNTITWILYDP